MSLSSTQKIIILIFYLILCILTETLYKEPLFKKSLSFESSFQKKFNSRFYSTYFSIITHFGSQVFYIPVFFIFFYYNPINYCFYIIITLIISLYIDCLLKIIYHDPRPYWIEKNLFKECEIGYGNPSGHSLGATATYFGIWNLSITNKFFRERKKYRIYTFIFTIFFIVNILISRLYKGVHSIDQIIYGALLGLGVYYFLYHIIKGYKWNPKEFFDKIDKGKIFMIPLFIFLVLFVLPFYFIFKASDQEINQYNLILNNLCPQIKYYLKYNNNGLLGCLLILVVFGMYLGLIFVKKKIDNKFPNFEYKIINWNNTSFSIKCIRGFVSLIFALPIILALIIPETNLLVIFIFKFGLSFFICGFTMFGPGIYYGYVISEKIEEKFLTSRNEINSKHNYSEINDEEKGIQNKASPPIDKFSIVEIQ